jgi:ADP-ribosylglycohydrolase
MRLAPVPLAFAADPNKAVDRSGERSRTTHALEVTVDACRFFGLAIAAAANGADKETVLSDELWSAGSLVPEIEAVARGSYRSKNPPEIRGGGYVVHSLEAALWALHTTDEFEEGALRAVNLGDDADTTGAVYGQLAGAIYGDEAISQSWRDRIALSDRIVERADGLPALRSRLS